MFSIAGRVLSSCSRIRPFCGRILLDQRLIINDLAVAASGENAAKLLNLTVSSALPATGFRLRIPRESENLAFSAKLATIGVTS